MSNSKDRHGRQRRFSARQSPYFPPLVRAPSIPLAQDQPTSGINFKGEHVKSFYMPGRLWVVLPNDLRPTVISMQHFGAAVITAIKKLERQQTQLRNNANEEFVADFEEDSVSSSDYSGLGLGMRSDELRTPSLTSVCSLALSTASSRRNSNTAWFEAVGRDPRIIDALDSPYAATPGTSMSPLELSPKTSMPLYPDTPRPRFRAQSGLPTAVLDQPTNLELSPGPRRRATFALGSSRIDEEQFTSPAVDPKTYRWRAQIDELRTNWLVELRHGYRKVEGNWNVMVTGEESQAALYRHNTAEFLSDSNDIPVSIQEPGEWAGLKDMMQLWLIDLKMQVDELVEKANSFTGGVTLGWSAIAQSKRL